MALGCNPLSEHADRSIGVYMQRASVMKLLQQKPPLGAESGDAVQPIHVIGPSLPSCPLLLLLLLVVVAMIRLLIGLIGLACCKLRHVFPDGLTTIVEELVTGGRL